MIRLWKLGDHSEGMLPGKEAIEKLMSILEQDKKGEVTDLVWDTLIDLTIINDDGTIVKA
jgi:hypothetical protein